MTLVEVVVAVFLLGLITLSLGAAFGIGFKVVGSGGSRAHLTGSNDVLSFEQQIGADVAKADCLAAPGQTSIPSYSGPVTGCPRSTGHSPSTCVSGYSLCLAWYQPGVSGAACHTVTYQPSTPTNPFVTRSDFSAGTTTTRVITTGDLSVSAVWSAVATSSTNGDTWTNRVDVTVNQAGTRGAPQANPIKTTFHVVPLAADPLSPAAVGSSPC
jgi:hypothetical protein